MSRHDVNATCRRRVDYLFRQMAASRVQGFHTRPIAPIGRRLSYISRQQSQPVSSAAHISAPFKAALAPPT